MSGAAPSLIFATSLLVACTARFGLAQFCQPLNATLFKRCISNAGYNYTFISNNVDFHAVEDLLSFIVNTEISNLAACSDHSDLLICSMYVPQCVEGRTGPILPCRRVCHDVIRGCENSSETLYYDDLEWIKGMCQFLPDKTGDSGICSEPDGFKPRYPAGPMTQQCLPMTPNACSSLGYNHTTQGTQVQKRTELILDSILSETMANHGCAPIMKRIICAEFLPPCYTEENGRPALYTACQSDCKILQEKCPVHFVEHLGNMGYCLELAQANRTAHGFCKMTQWPSAGRWSSIVATFMTNKSDPTHPAVSHHPTHGDAVSTHPTLKNGGNLKARSGSKHSVSLGAIIASAIVVSLLLIVAVFLIVYRRFAVREKTYRRHRNESEITEI